MEVPQLINYESKKKVLLSSDILFANTIKYETNPDIDFGRRPSDDVYYVSTTVKFNESDIFPPTNNNMLNYLSPFIFELDLLPFECPRIIIPANCENKSKHIENIMTFYIDLINCMDPTCHSNFENGFRVFLRKLTYINFVYGFITDNIHSIKESDPGIVIFTIEKSKAFYEYIRESMHLYTIHVMSKNKDFKTSKNIDSFVGSLQENLKYYKYIIDKILKGRSLPARIADWIYTNVVLKIFNY